LLDQVREKLYVKHCAIETEERYVHWIKRYFYFLNMSHQKDLGAQDATTKMARHQIRGGITVH
jgi:Phage integrase, N-terminal SAM-like domain